MSESGGMDKDDREAAAELAEPYSPEDDPLMKFAGVVDDENVPTDLSENLDFYAYGHRKGEPTPESESLGRRYLRESAAVVLAMLVATAVALVAVGLWLLAPFGERLSAAASVVMLASSALFAHLYKRGGLPYMPGSFAQKTTDTLTITLECLLIGIGSSPLAIALGLEPRRPWAWTLWAAGLFVWVVARNIMGVRDLLAGKAEEPEHGPVGKKTCRRENDSEEK